MANRFRNIRISKKLALLYIAAVTIFLLMLSLFYFFSIRDYVEGHTRELLTHALKQAKSNIEYKISIYNKFSDSMSLNKQIQEIIRGIYSDSVEKYDVKEQLFGQLDLVFKSYEDMRTLNLYITNYTLPNYKDLQITVNTCSVEELDSYTLGMGPKTKWVYDTPETLAKGAGRIPPMVFASQQQTAQKGEHQGQLYAAKKIIDFVSEEDLGLIKIDLDIHNFFGGIKTVGLEDNGWMDITDSELNVIYSGRNHEHGDADRKIEWNMYPELFEGAEKSTTVTAGNMNYVMVYDIMEATDWKIIYTIPMKDYYSNVSRMKIVTLLAFVLCIISFSTISSLIASKFTKKICELSDSMEKIQVGNFDVHISYRGEDEIGHLINGFNKMAVKLDNLVREVYLIQVTRKEAELKALQSQINPHFLYNTLASISWLGMRNNDKDITKISNSLAKFYKVALSKGRDIITVSDEIEHVKAYLDIQGIRYKNRISVVYSIHEEILATYTIKLILQPLIENSIMHGMWKDKEHINIRLVVEGSGDNIVWQVIDDGAGIGRRRQQELMKDNGAVSGGYGIVNVDQRIKLFYGDRYGITIFSRPGVGTVITIVTPVNRADPPA